MTTTVQNTQQLILNAASQLTTEQFETYQRLSKRLLHGPSFQLLLVDCRDERLQQQLQQLLSEVCQQVNLAVTSLKIDEQLADVFALQQQLITLSSNYIVIQLTGAASWFATAGRWADLNLLRENIAKQAPCRLIFWLNEESIAAMIDQAPDWWAWRSGVYKFDMESTFRVKRPEPHLNNFSLRHQHKDKSARRISILTNWLKSPEALDPEQSAPLWFELSCLYEQLGEWERALLLFQNECLPRFQQLGQIRNEAMTFGAIAQIYMLKGELDRALQIRLQRELPAYRKIENVRDIAITLGKIADILFRQGSHEEALKIWLDQVLPVLKSFGDIREVAVYNSRIADILLERNQPEDALKILRDVLSTLLQLGDIRTVAMTYGKIADVLFELGEFNEALTIILHHELPVYQKLGDFHSMALAQTSVADILAAQGKYAEAVMLLQKEALPELHRIGDRQNEATTQCKIADILFASGELNQALELYQTKILPLVLTLKNQNHIKYVQTKITEIQQLFDGDLKTRN